MRRVTRAVLTAAVRGRRDRGGPWGEAVLAEFDQTSGRWEALRWAAGGLRAVWHERRAGTAVRISLPRLIMATAVVGLVAAFVINQFALSARYMASGSMEPTLPVAGRFLLDKASFRVTGLERGDIVEFAMPRASGRHAVKRVIGLPGDTVACRDGVVYVDGAPLDEPYLQAGAGTYDCGAPVLVPPGELFVLGDHREVSQDSRHWGPVPQSAVEGRLLTTFSLPI
ncbi:signal peptidase I [Actinoplanes sp. NPDC049668]|uniref:signal peptidase I n=1 Tax=unclassified Actinoplanes TaxID=2626549 RepID=UPI0033BF0A61